MNKFLKPTKSKLSTFIIISASILIGVIFLLKINEPDIAGILIYPFATVPVKIFDAITGSAFAPNECYLLCFPTFPQVSFLILFDIVFIYLISCVVVNAQESRTE